MSSARDLYVAIRADPIDPAATTARVTDPRAGAVVTFCGVTREVPALEYEAHEQMAARTILDIAERVSGQHGLTGVAVEHRVGEVALSEPSVVIAVSAPHRAEAFAGARDILDDLKANAPIWKREARDGELHDVDGSVPSAAEPGAA